MRWKVASDLRFRVAISEPKAPSFCRISGDLAPSTWISLALAIVRFWCAKEGRDDPVKVLGDIKNLAVTSGHAEVQVTTSTQLSGGLKVSEPLGVCKSGMAN